MHGRRRRRWRRSCRRDAALQPGEDLCDVVLADAYFGAENVVERVDAEQDGLVGGDDLGELVDVVRQPHPFVQQPADRQVLRGFMVRRRVRLHAGEFVRGRVVLPDGDDRPGRVAGSRPSTSPPPPATLNSNS